MDDRTRRQHQRAQVREALRDSREARSARKMACAAGGIQLLSVAYSTSTKLISGLLRDEDLQSMVRVDYESWHCPLAA